MPIDSSIAMGVKTPTIENPLNALAQAMQLQGMQRQGELQGLQVQQAKQGMADEQAARQVISANQDAAPQDLIRKLRVVNPAMAQKMEAAQIDADLKRSQTKEHSAKGDELVAKMAKAKQDQMAAMAGSLSSLDQVPEFLNQMVAESSGKVTPDQVKKLQAAFAADFQGTKQRLLEQAMSPDALQKMRQPDFVEMFDGKNKFFFDRNPFSTTPDNKRRMGEVQMQATIAEQESARAHRASEALTARGQNMTQSTAIRGQDMTDRRAKDSLEQGKIPSGYKRLSDGSLQYEKGGPADPTMKPMPQKQRDQIVGIANLNTGIDEYLKELQSFGPGSYLNPSQIAKMGTKYNNMMLQAKEAYNLGVLNGPDYSILTSVIADPVSLKGAAIPRDALAAQAKELQRMMGANAQNIVKYGTGNPTAEDFAQKPGKAPETKTDGRTASGQVVQRVASDADFEKLPSGAHFVGPDGVRRMKP